MRKRVKAAIREQEGDPSRRRSKAGVTESEDVDDKLRDDHRGRRDSRPDRGDRAAVAQA